MTQMTQMTGLDYTLTMQIAINTMMDFDTLWNSEEYRKVYNAVMLDDGDLDYVESWVIDNLWDGKW